MLGTAGTLQGWTSHGGIAGDGRDVAHFGEVYHLRRRDGAPGLRVDLYWAARHVAERPLHHAHGLLHLLHAHQITIHVVATGTDRHVERQPVIDGVRAVLTHVVVRAGGAKKGAGDPVGDGVFGGDHARSIHAVCKDAVA